MIGDLSNAPEPVQIKLFSPDARLSCNNGRRKVGDAISNVPGVVDILNGIDNTISNPATVFHVNPTVTSRAGFTPEEVAIRCHAPFWRASRQPPRSHQRHRLHHSRALSRTPIAAPCRR